MAMTPLQSVLWDVKQRIENDKKLSKLRQKVNSGKATYADTAAYSTHVGNLLGDTFAQHILSVSPELREALTVELLHDRYMDINAIIDRVQKSMDEAQGLHLAPQHAPFDSERGHQIGSALADPTVPDETIKRRARAATATATKSMHDDRMKTEAKFRSRAGLKCFITRKAVSGCCAWCTAMAGRFEYGEEPDDIYRRHDNCDCTVTFENGRKRQDVWSKREWEAPEPGSGAGDRVVFTAEQARELEEKHQLEVLTTGRKHGTMELLDSIELFHGSDAISGDQKKTIEEALAPIPEKLLQQLSEFVKGIQIEDGRTFSSYNREKRTVILDKKRAAKDIVHELGHAFGDMIGVYEDPEFLQIIANGLDLQDWKNVVSSKHPARGTQVYFYKGAGAKKFMDPYQGRIYLQQDDIGKGDIAPTLFRDYISVGFDFYFRNPNGLKRSDPDLYYYLEALINGFAGSSN